MPTPQQILVRFMAAKQAAIADRFQGYFTDADRAELEGWGEEISARVVADIDRHMEDSDERTLFDGYTCPWCSRVNLTDGDPNSPCADCGYGGRHGLCETAEESTYHMMLMRLGGPFSSVVNRATIAALWAAAKAEVAE